jgi:hypothetical protein
MSTQWRLIQTHAVAVDNPKSRLSDGLFLFLFSFRWAWYRVLSRMDELRSDPIRQKLFGL